MSIDDEIRMAVNQALKPELMRLHASLDSLKQSVDSSIHSLELKIDMLQSKLQLLDWEPDRQA
jgi:hypothetical protein